MMFNEKLKSLRKEKGLTQEELAEKLYVSRQAITKWESGEGTPDIENLKQISKFFSTTIDELINDEKEVSIESADDSFSVEELEIDHTKHFDIKISKINELNILPNSEEKVKIEWKSENGGNLKVKIDDLYNRLDINIKGDSLSQDAVINMYVPDKYIDELELNSKIKTLNISNIDFKQFEYDGDLKHLNVKSSKGEVVLNTTKSDVEVSYDNLCGNFTVNIINSTARLELPKGTVYQTVLKGKKSEFVNATNTEGSENIIELNGLNSKLIINEK